MGLAENARMHQIFVWRFAMPFGEDALGIGERAQGIADEDVRLHEHPEVDQHPSHDADGNTAATTSRMSAVGGG